MLYIVLASILGVAILVTVAMAVFGKNPDNSYDAPIKSIGVIGAGISMLALVLMTLFMSITTVSARSVGIQTAFGRYSGTLDNGLQMTAPWSSVEEFSTQVQYLDLDGENDSVQVTFKGGGGGMVNATPRWRIDENKAENLWKKYKTFDKVRDQLVNSTARDSIRQVISKYTPNEARDGDNLRPIAEQVVLDLNAQLKDDGIVIDSVSIKGISLDKRSQESLDKIVEANNNVERAKAERERAKIDAETADIRKKSGQLGTDANQRYCLEMMNNWDVKKNGALPAGFVCPGVASQGYTTTNK